MKNEDMKRRFDLDWLRVIAFALLMLFHTGMMFNTWNWHIKNLETSSLLDWMMRFLHQWRMPLLFFISGSAVCFAMDRHSTWKFFLERHKRLLLPLAFGILVIIPPQVYYERLYQHQQYDSFWSFYPTIFQTGSYPQGNLSWHHLWYLPYIWVYSMIMLPVFVWLRSPTGRRMLETGLQWLEKPWILFLIFLPSAISEVVLRPFWPHDGNNLFPDWANFTHKLTFFVAGFILSSGSRLWDAIESHRRKFLWAGLLATVALYSIWFSHLKFTPYSAAGMRFLQNFHIWMWILLALGYGRRYLNFNHPFLRYANEAVYPFYILHQTVIVMLGYHIVWMGWSMSLKFLIVIGGTFLITWGLYAWIIRPFNWLRVPFGMKPLRLSAPVGLNRSNSNPTSAVMHTAIESQPS